MLLATLVRLDDSEGDGLKAVRAIGPVSAPRARGFTADLVILSHEPRSQLDLQDAAIFKECMSQSRFRMLVVKEET